MKILFQVLLFLPMLVSSWLTSLGKATTKLLCSTSILSEEQLETFRRDGVILVRGLVKGSDLEAAINTAKEISIQKNEYFNSYKQIKFQNYQTNEALRRLSLHGDVPKAASECIQAVMKTNRLRLLKDAVLCFSPGGTGCGWHVDDKFFWPCEDDYTGVNVWIALSPMREADGGGLAVAPGSNKDKIAQAAIPIIAKGGTCNMANLAPEVDAHLERIKVIYDMEPGDCIIHDRWCFHRSDSFKDSEKWPSGHVLNRYSIRYMPEEAKVFEADWNEETTGRGGKPLSAFEDAYPAV